MNEVRDIRRFRRLATGAAMIATAPIVLASVAIKPAEDGNAGEVMANLSSHSAAMEASLVLGLVAIALLIPATLGLLRVAQQRSPILALVGAGLTLLGWVAFMGMQVLGEVALVMATSPDRAAMASLYDQIGNSNVITVIQMGFIVGHVAGIAILGVAVARSEGGADLDRYRPRGLRSAPLRGARHRHSTPRPRCVRAAGVAVMRRAGWS